MCLTEQVTPRHNSSGFVTEEGQPEQILPPGPIGCTGTGLCGRKRMLVPQEKFWVHLDSQVPVPVTGVEV